VAKRKYTDEQLESLTLHVEDAWQDLVSRANKVQVEAGLGWYSVAHEEAVLLAAEDECMSVDRAAAIIAVLSPMCRWQGNLDDAWSVVTGGTATHALPENVRKAKRLAALEPLDDVVGGCKVRAFWQNIADPVHTGEIVVDTWVARAVGVNPIEAFGVVGVYEAVADGIRLVARRMRMRGNQCQAIGWVVIRDEHVRGQLNPNLPDTW